MTTMMMMKPVIVSRELHQAFNELDSSLGLRGLLAGIENEQMIPLQSIPSTSDDFLSDLGGLPGQLKDDQAAYVILRRFPHHHDAFIVVTYVPDLANVRQKMLFASSRLTLVRELGSDRVRATMFATEKADLSAHGFQQRDRHESQYASSRFTLRFGPRS